MKNWDLIYSLNSGVKVKKLDILEYWQKIATLTALATLSCSSCF